MSSYSALSALLSSSSSSAVDLSSILQAAYGASSSGINVTSAVNAAVTAARAPENAWASQASRVQSQISALHQLQTEASSLDGIVQALNNVLGPISARSVTSSNSSVVSASAVSGAASGNHIVVVNSLATTASWTSASFRSGSTALPSGSFTISTDSESTLITTDGTKTLSDVANEINADNLHLSASVITDASGARLAMVANATGTAADFSVVSPASFGFSQAAAGKNASLTVDGIQISSATNTVTGVVPGLTLNLLSANPNTEVSLAITPDTSQTATAINAFVADYNVLINDLSSHFTFNGSSEGVLATDSTVRSLQNQLLGALGYSYSPPTGSTTISNLSSLGISVNNDGTLTVDSGTLQSALDNHFTDVQNFFQGAAFDGFANFLDQQLTGFLSPSEGAFTVDLQSMNSQITDLEKSVSNFETYYITPLKAQLLSEYSQAEILLQQLPNLMKQIDAELGQNSKG